MISARTNRQYVGFVVALLTLLSLSQAAPTRNANEILVVVNNNNPMDGLSVAELRRILLGERRFWRGNVQLKLVLPPPGSIERERIVTTILGMSSPEFGRHWRDKVFRGEAPDEPPGLPCDSTMTRYVSQTPGALGFTTSGNKNQGFKVLKLDGKAPGEPGYIFK